MEAEIKQAMEISQMPGQSSGHDQYYLPPVDQRFRKKPSDPVGLRNIGNTCYFNSLLQIYYSMPQFVEQIFRFEKPKTPI